MLRKKVMHQKLKFTPLRWWGRDAEIIFRVIVKTKNLSVKMSAIELSRYKIFCDDIINNKKMMHENVRGGVILNSP